MSKYTVDHILVRQRKSKQERGEGALSQRGKEGMLCFQQRVKKGFLAKVISEKIFEADKGINHVCTQQWSTLCFEYRS